MNAPEQIDRIVAPSTASASASEEARLQVSALVDGELDDTTIERAIDALLASDDLADFWANAHRAGDWMRSDEVIGVGDGQLFLRTFSARLSAEPTILAPGGAKRARAKRFWIRTGLPGASIAAALVVVAWVATPFGRGDGGSLTASGKPTLVIAAADAERTGERALRPMDPDRLSDYLAAHRDVTPFGYRGAGARPASYTTPAGQTDSPPTR